MYAWKSDRQTYREKGLPLYMAHVFYFFCWNPFRNLRDIANLHFGTCPKCPKRQNTDLDNSKNTKNSQKMYHVFFFIVTYDIIENNKKMLTFTLEIVWSLQIMALKENGMYKCIFEFYINCVNEYQRNLFWYKKPYSSFK